MPPSNLDLPTSIGRGRTSPAARRRLLGLCQQHEAALVADWLDNIVSMPGFSGRRESIQGNVVACLAAFCEMLRDEVGSKLDVFVAEVADERFAAGSSIGVPLLAAAQFRTSVANLLAGAGQDEAAHEQAPSSRGGASDVDVLLAADALILQFERRFAEAFAQRSLFASEERYREIFEHSTEILVTVDRDGLLTHINARLETLLGHRRESWLGRRLSDLADPADAPALRELVTGALRGDAPREITVRCATRAGETKVMGVRLNRIPDGFSAFGLLRDLTDEVARRAQLVHGEKLASMGQLATSVAHELNNPLAWLLVNVEHIRDVCGRAVDAGAAGSRTALEAVARSAAEALAGIERMRGIVRDLNVFSGTGKREVEPLDLASIIELAIRMTGLELRRRCTVRRAFSPLPPLVGYAGELTQVFVNLFLNALEALPERPEGENLVTVAARHDGEAFVVEVSDNGQGIPAAVVERVFDPFFTLAEGNGRAGLGLWVTKSTVAAHGGTIEVESATDRGTTFTLRFRGIAPAPAPAVAAPESTAKATVLFVDDEPILLSAFRRAFDETHDVLTAQSGADALELLQERAGAVDAIVCDLLMPSMSGMDFYERVRAAFPSLVSAIVFMSGGACTERAQRFTASVANAHLEKPISLESLERAIGQVLAARAAERTTSPPRSAPAKAPPLEETGTAR